MYSMVIPMLAPSAQVANAIHEIDTRTISNNTWAASNSSQYVAQPICAQIFTPPSVYGAPTSAVVNNSMFHYNNNV